MIVLEKGFYSVDQPGSSLLIDIISLTFIKQHFNQGPFSNLELSSMQQHQKIANLHGYYYLKPN